MRILRNSRERKRNKITLWVLHWVRNPKWRNAITFPQTIQIPNTERDRKREKEIMRKDFNPKSINTTPGLAPRTRCHDGQWLSATRRHDDNLHKQQRNKQRLITSVKVMHSLPWRPKKTELLHSALFSERKWSLVDSIAIGSVGVQVATSHRGKWERNTHETYRFTCIIYDDCGDGEGCVCWCPLNEHPFALWKNFWNKKGKNSLL